MANLYLKLQRTSGLGDVILRALLLIEFRFENPHIIRGVIFDDFVELGSNHVNHRESKPLSKYFKDNYLDLSEYTVDLDSIKNPVFIDVDEIVDGRDETLEKSFWAFYEDKKYEDVNYVINTFYSECKSAKLFRHKVSNLLVRSRFRKKVIDGNYVVLHLRQGDTSILRFEDQLLYIEEPRSFYPGLVNTNKTVWEYGFSYLKQQKDLKKVIICSDLFDNKIQMSKILQRNVQKKIFSDAEWDAVIKHNEILFHRNLEKLKHELEDVEIETMLGGSCASTINTLEAFKHASMIFTNKESSGLIKLSQIFFGKHVLDITAG